MIKQLTIICNTEISGMVRKTLSRSGIQGFAHMQGAGTHVEKKSAWANDLTWPADLFIIPAEEELLRGIIKRLKDYSGKCEIQPCLKLILSSVEEFH